MSSSRLKQQFIRLWQCCRGLPQETTLSELATQLGCSRRHMRNLLNAMQQAGWLEWQAESGRGKRSSLTFRYTGLALQQQRAGDLLEQDRIDQLLHLVADKNQLREMVVARLGHRYQQGRTVLRLLYDRPLLNLLPGTPLRHAEAHMARQIFNGLTRINEENGEAEADIAHRWQQISPLHWRFFLRPAIRFHQGRELDMQDVVQSLRRLADQPSGTHLSQIHSPAPRTLDIHLHQPDRWLPWLLGDVSAMILPKEWSTLSDFARQPVGTGPYCVQHNYPTQLKIKAFDDYFALRPLTDEVAIWLLPEIGHAQICAGPKQAENGRDHPPVEYQLQEGCSFLLFDQRSPQGSNAAIRRWISTLLTPDALPNEDAGGYGGERLPARGLLPRWHHQRNVAAASQPAELESLTLTGYHHHAEHQAIASALRPLLAAHGVRLETREVSYEQWYHGEAVSDIWLGSSSFPPPQAYSLFARLYAIPLLRHCLPVDWEADARRWREGQLPLAEWSKTLVEDQCLLPLFHRWLQVEAQRSMQDLPMNALGWVDFKSAWFAPPEA